MRTLWCFSNVDDQAADHRDGDRLAGFLDLHHLEAAGQRGVFFEVLFVFGPGGGGDGAEFAAREGGLQQVGRVVLTGRAAGANHGVRFVDEQDDRLRAGLHLIDHAAQAIFELALHARAGLQQAEVERAQRDTFERRRHIAGRQPDGETFDDGGLADAGLAGHDRIVLPPPRQDIDDLTDFRIASQDRIDLAGFGLRGQIDGELFQRTAAAGPRHAAFGHRGDRRPRAVCVTSVPDSAPSVLLAVIAAKSRFSRSG